MHMATPAVNNVIPRRRPLPVPAIHALPEHLAEGSLKADYEDTKAVLQVPWMGVVAMAFAHYRGFFRVLWPALRPLFSSQPMIEACRGLRLRAEEAVLDLHPPPLGDRLAGLGYAPREIGQIGDTIEVFSHGNVPYAAWATITRLLLEGGEFGAKSTNGGRAPAFEGRHAPDISVPFVLIEPHHADAPTRTVYDDIMARLGLPFVNTDYRALARWPSYFALAWGDLRAQVQSEGYERMVDTLHRDFVETVQGLPNPGGLTGTALREAAAHAPPGEILHMVRLFQWLLPGLILNIAYFREQLRDGRGNL